MNTGAILSFALKQVSPGVSSVSLEVAGCAETLTEMEDMRAPVDVICTDCSASVAKRIREDFPTVEHQHDVYHIEKRITKKLTAKANIRGNEALRPWIKPITNHLWWAAQTCTGEEDLIERWTSCIHHTVNHHQWDDCIHYKRFAFA